MPDQRNVVLMVGGAMEFKNPFRWLDIAKTIIELSPRENLVFRWVGDGPLLPEMRKWVERNRLTKRIELTRYLPNPSGSYDEALLYLQVSRRESLSFAALDALRAGLPMAVSKVGGLVELVEDNRNGLLLDDSTRDPGHRIAELIAEQPRLSDFSEASRRKFEREFSPEIWEQRMFAVLNRV